MAWHIIRMYAVFPDGLRVDQPVCIIAIGYVPIAVGGTGAANQLASQRIASPGSCPFWNARLRPALYLIMPR